MFKTWIYVGFIFCHNKITLKTESWLPRYGTGWSLVGTLIVLTKMCHSSNQHF